MWAETRTACFIPHQGHLLLQLVQVPVLLFLLASIFSTPLWENRGVRVVWLQDIHIQSSVLQHNGLAGSFQPAGKTFPEYADFCFVIVQVPYL